MRKNETVEDFTNWLKAMDVPFKPTLHVNGNGYNTAVVSVDFGSPKDPVKLTAEQGSELASRLKEVTTSITGRRNVRVNFDYSNGMYWSSI